MFVEALNFNPMFDLLNKYPNNGSFEFKSTDSLSNVCNAPKNKSGVYIVYAVKGHTKYLIYIGCSGLEDNGEIKLRKGGMCGDRKSTRLNSSHNNQSRMPSSA